MVMLLKILACVAVVSRRKQYAPRTRSKFGSRVRGGKVGEARGKGVGRCDWDVGGCVGGDHWVFVVGSAVFVAPVECGVSWDGLAWG